MRHRFRVTAPMAGKGYRASASSGHVGIRLADIRTGAEHKGASVAEFSNSALIAACVSAETFNPRARARSANSSGTYTFNRAIHTTIHTTMRFRAHC